MADYTPLRIEMLIDKHGKDKVREAFAGAITAIVDDDLFCNYSVELPSLDYLFKFPVNCEYEIIDGKQVRKEQDMVQLLKSQAFYVLLE